MEAQEKVFIGAISDNNDQTVYTAMQNIWFANEYISYFSIFPQIRNRVNPPIELREGEGKSKKYILEASLLHQLPIMMGRNHSNPVWQTSRLTLDYGFNVRMAQDESNPLVPNNNVIGLGFNKYIFNSHTKNGNKEESVFEDWKSKKEPLWTVSFDNTIRHYSNGQQPGFFLYDTINGNALKRNDYKEGDFSTNYIRSGFTFSYLSSERDLISCNVSYQWDGTFGGPFVFSDEQEKSYGHSRLIGYAQLRKLFWKNHVVKDSRALNICNNETLKVDYRKPLELVVRWEYEYIMGDMLNYNIENNKKHRFNQHLFVQVTRPNWRALGLVAHFYTGRDYSNIRYDMPIYGAMLGVSLNVNKYKQAFSYDQRVITDK